MANEILHFNGYTIRAVGVGDLYATFKGFDNILTKALVPITLATTSAREPTRMGNFNSQRAILRLETTQINEWVKVNNITVWLKPIWKAFPM